MSSSRPSAQTVYRYLRLSWRCFEPRKQEAICDKTWETLQAKQESMKELLYYILHGEFKTSKIPWQKKTSLMVSYWITSRNPSSNSLALQWIFLSSTYSLILCADFCVGNHSINNPTDYECTRRKQSVITWGCADIYEARKMNSQFWVAPVVFLSSYIRGRGGK